MPPIAARRVDRGAALTAYPALNVRERALILALVVGQFLVVHGPVWRHVFDWDRAILASYATIPFVVLAALAWKRRLGWLPWLLHTVEIAALKFFVTASFLVIVLVVSGARGRDRADAPRPPSPPPVLPARAPPTPRALVPTVIPPSTTGRVAGVVTGAGTAGAVVWISGGLERFVFAPPPQGVATENDGRGFTPALAIVQAGQRFVARSKDSKLHTLLLVRGHDWIHNLPVLASGDAEPTFPDGLTGIVRIRCTVHGARESEAHLLLTTHPFAAVVGSDGRFAFDGVPQGALEISAFHPDTGAVSSARATLVAGGEAAVTLPLSPPAP